MAETDRYRSHALHFRVLHQKAREEALHQSLGGAEEEGRRAARKGPRDPQLEERWLALRLPVVGVDGGGEGLCKAKRRACRAGETTGATETVGEISVQRPKNSLESMAFR